MSLGEQKVGALPHRASCLANLPAVPAQAPPTPPGGSPRCRCAAAVWPQQTLTSREEAMEKARGRIWGMRSSR